MKDSKLMNRLRGEDMARMLRAIYRDAETARAWKVRVNLLRGVRREGLIDSQAFHDEYVKSLKAYAKQAIEAGKAKIWGAN